MDSVSCLGNVHERVARPVRWASILLFASTCSLVGCVAEIAPAPAVPYDYYYYPYTFYDGRTVYYMHGNWYYPYGNRWYYYRTVPPGLRYGSYHYYRPPYYGSPYYRPPYYRPPYYRPPYYRSAPYAHPYRAYPRPYYGPPHGRGGGPPRRGR